MAERATPIRSHGAGADPVDADLREELGRGREEILRLRDLLIAKDAELGAAKGRVAELEAGTARLLGLVARVRALVPAPLWSALARLRGRRSQG